ncbi:hypothetical protein K457DRAFT_411532 [Linnemannia elongata AG-77]|uniref:Uncharacterized protein n=1 Tax=Linnemannia elongata AG-77 TaxID=1314771 RepID=A0A197K0Z2_9FUNG|nr:hypothetical protein K457DRAFT_411532 [Linnemannia elongata AG-77]
MDVRTALAFFLFQTFDHRPLCEQQSPFFPASARGKKTISLTLFPIFFFNSFFSSLLFSSLFFSHLNSLYLPTLSLFFVIPSFLVTTAHILKYTSKIAANLPSSSTLSSILRLPPPRPSSAMSTRLPVRLGLGDPRLQSYMISAKPTPSTSSSATAAMAASSSSFGRQDRIPAVGVTAPGGSYPSDSSNSHHRAIPPFHPPSSSPSISAATLLARSTPDQSSSRTYPESPSMRQASISHSNNGQWNDSKAATAGGRHSTSPGSQPRSLPSPTPSMTPMSPDWQLVGRQSHDPSPQQHPQQHRTHQQHDLLSPSASEMELGSDTKPLTPLFRSNSPPAFNSISHRPSLSASHLGPAHMTNSLSLGPPRSDSPSNQSGLVCQAPPSQDTCPFSGPCWP